MYHEVVIAHDCKNMQHALCKVSPALEFPRLGGCWHLCTSHTWYVRPANEDNEIRPFTLLAALSHQKEYDHSVHKPATLPPLLRTYHVGLSRFNVCLACIRPRLLSQISPLALQRH